MELDRGCQSVQDDIGGQTQAGPLSLQPERGEQYVCSCSKSGFDLQVARKGRSLFSFPTQNSNSFWIRTRAAGPQRSSGCRYPEATVRLKSTVITTCIRSSGC
jgi:hypothetical protein